MNLRWEGKASSLQVHERSGQDRKTQILISERSDGIGVTQMSQATLVIR